MNVPEWQVAGSMASAQRNAILAALLATAYNLTHAARRLHIGRTTLYRLMKAYDIPFSIRRPDDDAAPAPRSASHVILIDGGWYLVGEGAQARG